jgi:hypothetical protein
MRFSIETPVATQIAQKVVAEIRHLRVKTTNIQGSETRMPDTQLATARERVVIHTLQQCQFGVGLASPY